MNSSTKESWMVAFLWLLPFAAGVLAGSDYGAWVRYPAIALLAGIFAWGTCVFKHEMP